MKLLLSIVLVGLFSVACLEDKATEQETTPAPQESVQDNNDAAKPAEEPAPQQAPDEVPTEPVE